MKPIDFGIKNLPEYIGLVDKKLISLVPKYIKGTERFLYASGKRLRPNLVILVVFYSDKKIDDNVINAAAAVEIVHLASLVHDDIIDDGNLRWGEPTINSNEGSDIAILAGDYLFAKGCALASSVSSEAGELMAETIADLCEGQAIELSDQFNINRSVESLNSAILGKTSSMFKVSCLLGRIVSGMQPTERKKLSNFAENFGIYYQYKDDIADFIESPNTAGKSVGNDVREGNYTLPVLLSLQGPNKAKLTELLEDRGASTSEILGILKSDKSIERTLDTANKYKRKAYKEIEKLDNRNLAKALQLFADNF